MAKCALSDDEELLDFRAGVNAPRPWHINLCVSNPLLDFRAGVNAPLRQLERGLAYEAAAANLTSYCLYEKVVKGRTFYDTASATSECEKDVRDAVLYLDLSGLLFRDPADLNFVCLKDHPQG